jgi:hypothetical protein
LQKYAFAKQMAIIQEQDKRISSLEKEAVMEISKLKAELAQEKKRSRWLAKQLINKSENENKKLLKENYSWADDFIELTHELAKVRGLLEDVLWQACADIDDEQENKLDNMCLSAYEKAMSYLAKIGRIKDYDGRIGYLVEEAVKNGE